MWQKAGETASCLIIEKDSKSIGCKAAVDVLIKGTLSHSGPAVQIDDGFGLHRDSLWRIELAVGNPRSGRQLPVLCVRVRDSFGKMRTRRPQYQDVQAPKKDESEQSADCNG